MLGIKVIKPNILYRNRVVFMCVCVRVCVRARARERVCSDVCDLACMWRSKNSSAESPLLLLSVTSGDQTQVVTLGQQEPSQQPIISSSKLKIILHWEYKLISYVSTEEMLPIIFLVLEF